MKTSLGEFISRIAKPGSMLLAAIALALILALVYDHGFFGTLQYVTAFAFYLAVMMTVAPLPALLLRRGRVGAGSWLALLLAASYAGNGIYVGRQQTVTILAIGGAVVGLLVGMFAARRDALPQA